MRQFLMILMILALAPLSQAQSPEDLTIITVEGTSKADSPAEASREIQAKAMADTAREQVIEIIGDKKYQKNKQLVETKIVRESARFIPFTQPGPLEQNADGYKMSLELKLSLASLKKMIQNTGLLYDSEAVTAMVPMVGFIDRVHALGYRWPGRKQRDCLLRHRAGCQARAEEIEIQCGSQPGQPRSDLGHELARRIVDRIGIVISRLHR